MPCWPEVWTHFKQTLPELFVFTSLAAYGTVVGLLFAAPKLRKQWQRDVSRSIGALLAVPLIFVLPALLLAMALANSNPPTKSRVVKSPDGREATLNYNAGFLGRDYTEITLKRAGCCRHIPVFWHSGPSWFNDPQLEWLDRRHLHLTYHARPADDQHCEHQLEEIVLTCTSLPWKQGSSETKTTQ